MIKSKVLETIKKYNLIEKGDKIVLGVSGGPDSITMFYILNEFTKILDFEIYVAHINHGIREESTDDEKYVENCCKKFDVPFFVLQSNVEEIAKAQKLGVEETGRKIRYDFFDEVAKKVSANKIAVAHNKNDNSETIIMNILREEIEDFCSKEKIEPRIDKTNFENEYTRNKIRNIVIPYIKNEFNPNIVNSLERLSEIMREQEEFIEEEAEKQYKNILINEIKLNENEYNIIIIDLKKFNCLPKIIEKKIILLSIQKLFGTVKRIEKIRI